MYMGFSGATSGKQPPASAVRDGVTEHTRMTGLTLKNSSLGELGSNSLYKDGLNIIQQHGSL